MYKKGKVQVSSLLMAVFPLSCAIYSKKASEITNKITNYGQILPLTNIHIFHEHQRNFINTGGWHAFPCVNPPTTELTITWNQSATPPYDISNTLVRSEIMGDLLKITFHPPQDLNELLYAPLTSRNILEFPSGPSDGLLVSKALKTKTALCYVYEPAVSAWGMSCKPRQAISCQNLSDPFCHIPSSLNKFTSYQRQ